MNISNQDKLACWLCKKLHPKEKFPPWVTEGTLHPEHKICKEAIGILIGERFWVGDNKEKKFLEALRI
jgi:hypothetical protein